MKHPKFWGVLAAGGQRGEGLILYLLNRNKAVFSMTTEEKEELQMRKQRIIYLLVLIVILVIFLFASVIVRFYNVVSYIKKLRLIIMTIQTKEAESFAPASLYVLSN